MKTLLIGVACGLALLWPAGSAWAQGCAGHSGSHGAPGAGAPHMAACCAGHDAQTPHSMPGCGHCDSAGAAGCEKMRHEPLAVPAANPAPAAPLPVRTMEVVFREPVLVGGKYLLGWYVIEHDDERMARGEPCTYIFEQDTMREPIVTFHCTHLERDAPATATVVLRPTPNPSIKALSAFQFGGEHGAHGVPNVR